MPPFSRIDNQSPKPAIDRVRNLQELVDQWTRGLDGKPPLRNWRQSVGSMRGGRRAATASLFDARAVRMICAIRCILLTPSFFCSKLEMSMIAWANASSGVSIVERQLHRRVPALLPLIDQCKMVRCSCKRPPPPGRPQSTQRRRLQSRSQCRNKISFR